MRVILIVAWLFVGLGGLIYHFGPGQQRLELDQVDQAMLSARELTSAENWEAAIEQYDLALAALPAEQQTESQMIHLEKAKAQMMAKQLPEARQTLGSLLEEVRQNDEAGPELVADVQSTLANSQYYMTWLMRLEGLPEEQWKPEIEAARQHYTQLVRDAEKLGNQELLSRSQEDLESSIRLARMDLSELQGLPLPCQ